ncbi:MAG: hypothetical protein AB1558_04905 [Thermodesulfobacteriota bacterium]
MEDQRKKWIPPQLIVLGRGTPEENVLIGCKMSTLTGQSTQKKGCCDAGTCNNQAKRCFQTNVTS